jgi:PKHD-type hydroxylase
MLLSIPDILTAAEVRQARELLDSAPWGDGRASAGDQAVLVKHNEQLPHDCEAARTVRAAVLRGLDRQPLFLSAALPRKVFTPRFNRYSGVANHYGEHVDNAIRFSENGQRVRTDVSCTVFLSDPGEYDGGELVIRDTFGTQSVKLQAGHAVLYPGTSVHQVLPVTRGARVACFFWIESMVRSDEQRRLLYDMDMALMQLRRQHGDSAATTALTGTYHNLLRQWADT